MAKFYKGENFDLLYKEMLSDLIENPEFICAPRGLPIRENLCVTYELTDPTKFTINFLNTQAPERQEIYEKYRKAELEWYLSGDLSAASAPSKFWLNIADRHGNITSNYGSMMIKDRIYPGNTTSISSRNKTALEHVVDILIKDPSSRQAICHYNMPNHYFPDNKDIPCTLNHQFFIRENKLYMVTNQRSCDICLGLQFDSCWSCEFMVIVQNELAKRGLNVELGTFTHNMGSLHAYDNKLPLLQRISTPK